MDNNNVSEGSANLRVLKWLAKQFKTREDDLSRTLRYENATVYLLIWPVMEQKLFSGFLTIDYFGPVSDMLKDYYEEMNVDHIVLAFYKHFQIKDNLKGIVNKKTPKRFLNILKAEFDDLSCEDRIFLMMFTVYRYRNNIFHGNKKIEEWPKYHKQINDCTEFMMRLVDTFQKKRVSKDDLKSKAIEERNKRLEEEKRKKERS